MCHMMTRQQAYHWILDEGELSPYEDPRYQHLAGNYTDNNRILILSYCISYGREAIISSRFLLTDKDKWPLPLMLCGVVSYPLNDNDYLLDDPFRPERGWCKLLIGDDRTRICDVRGQQLYQLEPEEELPKEMP